MKKRIKSFNYANEPQFHTFEAEMPNVCPCCGHAIDCHIVSSYYFVVNESSAIVSITFFCQKCEKFFYGDGVSLNFALHTESTHICRLFPISENISSFSDEIQKLSPEFVSIYNQAQIAESHGLDKICGMAYRKSIEFLIKDFAIHNNPDKKSQIEAMPLASCIGQFIPEASISTLAQKAAWIGNDETHYVRKHQSRDTADLKKFITAAVYFINMTLVVEDAASI